MSPTGCRESYAPCDAGFTLFELLVVMALMAMTVVAVSAFYRPSSSGLQVKAAARIAASRLRDLRAAALSTGTERVAVIDTATRTLHFGTAGAPLPLARSVSMTVTGAESERRSPSKLGIRFFPNGSSTGGTVRLRSERQAYEIRINWLTGRVATAALN